MIYENQNLSEKIPAIILIKRVWISNINPIERGWFNWVNIMDKVNNKILIIDWKIQKIV